MMGEAFALANQTNIGAFLSALHLLSAFFWLKNSSHCPLNLAIFRTYLPLKYQKYKFLIATLTIMTKVQSA